MTGTPEQPPETDAAQDGPVDRRGFLRLVGTGAAVAGTSATASAQEDGEGGDGGDGEGGGGGGTQTVDMTDSLVFEPAEVTVAPGTTVVWENVGQQGHSVTAYEEEIPEDAEYFASGGFDNESDARSAYPSEGDIPGGESYEHTFETLGTYEYFCIPHEGPGMVGTVEVAEGGGGGGGSAAPVVSQSAQMLGVATSIALAATLGLAYFFMKFGGDYAESE